MDVYFFERDSVDFVSIKTDASTTVELAATEAHKLRFKSQWDDFSAPKRAHNEDGTFAADDPATPENEAYTKPKKTRKKKAK